VERWDPFLQACVPNLGPPPPNNRLTNDAARSYAQAFEDLVGAPTTDEGILTTDVAIPYPGIGGFPRVGLPRIGLTPAQRRAAVLAALVALGCPLLTGDQADVQTRTDEQSRRRYPEIVVELGPGYDPDNLLRLAMRFPKARIYGIEDDLGHAMVLKLQLASLGAVGSRIDIIAHNYATYSGALQNKADVVVAVAPNPGAPIDVGIRNFIKSGGTLLALTELRAQKDSIVAASGGKAMVHQIPIVRNPGNSRVTVPVTSLGMPLSSEFLFSTNDPWEIFVPSW
jgi:hypothetical protein